MKELEFTVTTLHQQSTSINSTDNTVKSTVPLTQRHRLASIKTRSLSRVVRARLTKSLYGSHMGHSSTSANTLTESIQEAPTASPKPDSVGQNGQKSEQTTPKNKPKHRSKLCTLL